MRRTLSADELRALRLRAQRLAGQPARDVRSAVTRAGGLQAQAAGPARLAARVRTAGLTADDVDRACDVDRAVVRTWAMRGTLHMVPATNVRWMVGLLGPVFARAGRRRRERLGLDDRTCERGLAAIEKVLRDSAPLTRGRLVERIADEGVRIDAATQAPAHLVAYAAMRGLICRGPNVGSDEPTYVLLDDWVDDRGRLGRDEALAELARGYLAGYGPATVHDFLTWSGLPAADGKKAFALISDEIVDVEADGTAMSALSSTELDAAGEIQPRLLGHFDALLLGYRGRDLVLDPAYGRRIQAGGGFIRPAVLVGGRVVGTWRLDRRGNRLAVVAEPFGGLPRDGRDGLRAEAEDVGRFLGFRDGGVAFHVAQ
ncbi:MAG: winged helix DNA-binding domain-containing protein [Streptosporangiales bacterium]|nr:winged helix DNA-binding domain-containing protein [Streptosporangiales bacterium]